MADRNPLEAGVLVQRPFEKAKAKRFGRGYYLSDPRIADD